MLPFYKRAFSVNLSKDYIVQLRENLCQCLKRHSENIEGQRDALSMIYLYQANIDCLIACRIELKHIFDQAEL